jgi:hypothetical protein
MTAVKFISHDETAVLLWMTADPPAGPFDTTMKMWNACIDKLARQGYVERTGESANEVTVTPAGEARAEELRHV